MSMRFEIRYLKRNEEGRGFYKYSLSKFLSETSFHCSHQLVKVTTWYLDSDSVVTVVNCRSHGDNTAIGSPVMHPAADGY